MTTEDFKAKGNQAFSQGDYSSAIELFTQAIAADPSNHVLYSNRSAAYCSLKNYQSALDDATKTVELKKDWAKGYSRKGAAFFGLKKFEDAIESYKSGLEIDPSNAQLKKGMDDAESELAGSAMGGLGNLFGPDMWSKIAANPKLSPYLAQPDFVAKLQELQKNPNSMNMYMNDPRMMNLIMGLMGIDGNVATSAEQAADLVNQADSVMEDTPLPPKQTQPPVQKPAEPKPEPELLNDEEKAKKASRSESDAEKDLGNKFYKSRKFEDALVHYNKAWELDSTNIAVLTNKSAVLFEMENFDECIKVCEEAVEVGRSIFADFKLIARAFSRIGNAYLKKGNCELAIKFFEKSLAEHRTPDVLNKLRETEKLKKDMDKEAYRDPVLADQAREEGNQLFKKQDYVNAVKFYTEAIKRNDADPKNYTNRAACYVKLMALSEADKDCDCALKIDPKFIKGYIRKASVLLAKKDYMKAMTQLKEAKSMDIENKHTSEIDQLNAKCYYGLNDVQNGANREETLKRAQNDPEVQKIMADPTMQLILKQMQEDPSAARDHLKNPVVAEKINVLINAGVISMR